MNILIIDDERLARREMVRQIGELLPNTQTLQASGINEARALLLTQPVDCVLLDLEMPGGHGMDFLPELNQMGQKVIIITGYEQHAVRSYDFVVVDYLLKPVETSRLARAFAKLGGGPNSSAQATRESEIILFNDQNRCWPVNVADIMMIEASGSYVTIHTRSRAAIVLCRSLKEVQPMLNESLFIKANRSQIIRLDCLGSIRKLRGGGLAAELDGHGDIIFSRRQAAAFRARFRL